MPATIDRPEPEPVPTRAASACQNRSKTCAQAVGVEPGAVVAHGHRRHPVRLTGPTPRPASRPACAAGRWLTRLAMRLAEVVRSPSTTTGSGRVEGDRPVRCGRDRVGAGVGGQHRQVDRLALARAVSSSRASRSRSSTSVLHARRLLLDATHDDRRGPCSSPSRAEPEQLGEALDRGQRRAQLVGRVGQELAQPLLGRVPLAERLLDLAEHRVQRQAQLAHLGPVVGRAHPVARGRRR